jgi:hypothetical protein
MSDCRCGGSCDTCQSAKRQSEAWRQRGVGWMRSDLIRIGLLRPGQDMRGGPTPFLNLAGLPVSVPLRGDEDARPVHDPVEAMRNGQDREWLR